MRSPLLMLIPAVLLAQRSALPPQEAFDRELQRGRLGLWLVLEDDGAGWGTTIRAALDDDALVQLNLPLVVASGGKKPDVRATMFRERYGWAKGAHWALVDAKGRVLVEGTSLPTVTRLVSAAEQAGVRSRTQELEDFLKQNPDHLEAQCALLRELVSIANRRTAKTLGPAPETPGNGAAEAVEPPRKLGAEDDLRIWAPVAMRLDRLFKGAWREAGLAPSAIISAAMAEHSPAMIALLIRCKGDMEEALRRTPSALEPWFLWLAASRKCGGWPLSPLLQSLQPLPGTSLGEWPPWQVMNVAIRDMKARRDWVAIREVLEVRWDALKGVVIEWGEGWWNMILSPLLEAMVSLGDVGAADQLLNEAAALGSWSGLPGQARNLATRLNRPDLAARWGAITPKAR